MKQRGLAPILIILLIAAAIGGYLVYSGKINTSKKQVVQTPKVDDTANWKTYTNNIYGYTLKYPSEWEYKFGKGNKAQIIFGSSPVELRTDVPGFLISVSETIEQPLIKEDGRNRVTETKQITIGGQSGEQAMINDAGSGEVSYIQSAVAYNGKTYYFNIHDFNKKPVYDQMISTFKFLDQNQADGTANWKTYINQSLGFNISYPNNWEVDDSNLSNIYIYSPNKAKDNQKFYINIQTESTNKDFTEWLKNKTIGGTCCAGGRISSPYTLDKNVFYAVLSEGTKYPSIIGKTNGRIYFMTSGSGFIDGGIYYFDQTDKTLMENIATFDKITKSIKF